MAEPIKAFDEMGEPAAARAAYAEIARWLAATPVAQLERKRQEAELLFRRIGVTFAVYGEGGDPERLIPFDIIPRILAWQEWEHLSRGLTQRVRALNMFLVDVYGPGEILKAGRIPEALILQNEAYRPEMRGITPPGGIYVHIAGIDVVRTDAAQFHVLEDNCRTPSGVSYMLEGREAMLRLFPGLCAAHRIAPVSHYPSDLLETLMSVAPPACRGLPRVVLLTPGAFNSAYYEHCFLADEMGVEVVEGQDLFVEDRVVFMRTTAGPQRVDVIYRRIDDDFLDPLAFRSDSALGVAGLLNAYRAGNITLANAIGTGIADDKSIYPYVPDMIEFYLGEKPILNNVPTYQCRKAEDLAFTLANIEQLVVKETHGAGGYGMLVGPASTKAEIAQFKEILIKHPDQYMAQPTLALSTCPTFVDSGIAPRHIDLRPFVLSGKTIKMVPGGLTRVALKEGSLVVNSSQGGGTKDTWVLED
jgi:uncharacterized circularly permuted ATP-grasp superfamily protein